MCRFQSGCLRKAKQSLDELYAIKLKLRAVGYYDDKPRCIRPISERLQMADAHAILDEFASRFGIVQEKISEYADSHELGSKRIDIRARAMQWADQFEKPEFIECALDLLKRSRIVGPEDVVEALRTFLRKFPEFCGASVVPLGVAV